MTPYIIIGHYLSLSIIICHYLSLSVIEPRRPLGLPAAPGGGPMFSPSLSLHDTLHHYRSLSVIIGHYLSLSIIICHRTTKTTRPSGSSWRRLKRTHSSSCRADSRYQGMYVYSLCNSILLRRVHCCLCFCCFFGVAAWRLM